MYYNKMHCFNFQATSKLLVNYPEEQRNQILDFLFKVSCRALAKREYLVIIRDNFC